MSPKSGVGKHLHEYSNFMINSIYEKWSYFINSWSKRSLLNLLSWLDLGYPKQSGLGSSAVSLFSGRHLEPTAPSLCFLPVITVLPGALSLTLVSWTRDLKDFENDTPRLPSKKPFWSGLSPWQLFWSGSCPSNEIFTPQTTHTIPDLQRRWERDESGRTILSSSYELGEIG